MGIYDPQPGVTDACYNDASDNEYYGTAPKGSSTSSARWKIMKIEKTAGVGTEKDWIIKYPNGSDEPKFIWDDVASYSYKLLGT